MYKEREGSPSVNAKSPNAPNSKTTLPRSTSNSKKRRFLISKKMLHYISTAYNLANIAITTVNPSGVNIPQEQYDTINQKAEVVRSINNVSLEESYETSNLKVDIHSKTMEITIDNAPHAKSESTYFCIDSNSVAHNQSSSDDKKEKLLTDFYNQKIKERREKDIALLSKKQKQSKDNQQKSKNQNQQTTHCGEKTMNDLTQFDLASLEEFQEHLESFLEKITHQCDKMESGIMYCRNYMKDESSAIILNKSNLVISEIRKCINPTVKIHQKVHDLIVEMKTNSI